MQITSVATDSLQDDRLYGIDPFGEIGGFHPDIIFRETVHESVVVIGLKEYLYRSTGMREVKRMFLFDRKGMQGVTSLFTNAVRYYFIHFSGQRILSF